MASIVQDVRYTAVVILKRILFIYECLLELPVAIHRGDVVSEVAAFARTNHSQTIMTMDSPTPGFANICKKLKAQGFQLHVYHPKPFVTLPESTDLRRFSRYWRIAKNCL